MMSKCEKCGREEINEESILECLDGWGFSSGHGDSITKERLVKLLAACLSTPKMKEPKWPEIHTLQSMPDGISTLKDIREYRNDAIIACKKAWEEAQDG